MTCQMGSLAAFPRWKGGAATSLPVDSHVDTDRDEAMATSSHRLHCPSMNDEVAFGHGEDLNDEVASDHGEDQEQQIIQELVDKYGVLAPKVGMSFDCDDKAYNM
ncbi:unnamed protein product [Urochloa humidicola]